MDFINKILKVFVGDKSQKDIKEIQPLVNKIKKIEPTLVNLSHDELRAKTVVFKNQIAAAIATIKDTIDSLKEEIEATSDIDKKETLYAEIDKLNDESYVITEKVLLEILPEAYAVVKETAKRFTHEDTLSVLASAYDRELSATKEYISLNGDHAVWETSWDAAGTPVVWNMIHYDVQLIGGIGMHQGKIAEMHTGEGKTLVATLPVYLNALTGNGVHLVTVNDYLAKRDSAWMAPIFQFHGLTVDCIDYYQPNSPERKAAYNADITYGTNNEFGFDYLRDNMSHTPNDLVQRKHNYAIIDEVDSVLVDDARTPLIISGPVPQGDRHEFTELKPKVADIVEIQRKHLVAVLSEAKKLIKSGDTKEGGIKLLRVFRGLPKNKALIKFLSEEGIRQLLQKTENFYMADNNKEMPKVDAELYFVIEEKNNQIELTDKGIDYLSGGDNRDFFVMPDIGTEIAKIEDQQLKPELEAEQKEELYRDFSIKSERIHTLNQLLKAYTLFEKDTEYVVMENKVMIVDESTGRIMDGRRYSDGLHQAIEAKENVKIEAATQTFATVTLQNFFRMYNKLSGMTGTAVTEAGELWEIYKLDVVEIPTNRPIARDDREDLVYKTKREKYNAVIDQVTELSKQGRPVLIGTTSVEISELLSRMLKIRSIPHNVLNAKMHKKEADIVAEAGQGGFVTIATNMAGRGTDIKLSDAVKEAGGLAIIGTERHDSRRVDRQLRGRSGRQGDPGSSQFYVSLEDNLMRLFGSERIAKMMDRMGLEEGEVIQHSMITKSIERAQKKVEENNFGIRKRLLEFDDVMNSQRTAIYNRRKNALFGDKLDLDIDNMIYDICNTTVVNSQQNSDFEDFNYNVITSFGIESPFNEKEFLEKDANILTEELYKEAKEKYLRKAENIKANVFPVIKNIHENQSDKIENIVIPFTDGRRAMKVVAKLSKVYETEGSEALKALERNITLAFIDNEWKEHLREMDFLKQSVYHAQYEQKDPLLIYKLEGYELFQSMMDKMNRDIISFLMKAQLHDPNEETLSSESSPRPKQDFSKLKAGREDVAQSTRMNSEMAQQNQSGQPVKHAPVMVAKKPGRNERVKILNLQNGETKEMKFKQAEPLISSGTWQMVN